MRSLLQLMILCAVAIAGCSGQAGSSGPKHAEDCAVAGDEDGNGLADCADPVCAVAVACHAVCGNGKVEAGESCDDGNVKDGDGCDSNCSATACGNGVVTEGEACDDGNTRDGDGCDARCGATPSTCGNGVVTEGEACDDGNTRNWDGCSRTCVAASLAYVKASNTGAQDGFGSAVALSADGTTLAVGACNEASAATGVDGDQADNAAPGAGAVYLYTRTGAGWRPQAYLKASNANAGDEFGCNLALSADGATLAVAAAFEGSAATGIDGAQADNSAPDAGAVYVFTRSAQAWSQQAYLKASNSHAFDNFGISLALSGDGATLAVGAYNEASAATGIDGNQGDDSARAAGAVYVFIRSGVKWSQQAYVKASNTEAVDEFGASVALSGDGSVLAVGALDEDGAETGINGNQTSNAATSAGAAYVFTRRGTAWSQEAYVKASNTGAGDHFGQAVALSADGSTLAVGADGEASAADGVDGDQANNDAPVAGAVYVFSRGGGAWSEQAYVKASNPGSVNFFGRAVALSANGSVLEVGAIGESASATGVNTTPDRTVFEPVSGAAYVFERSGTWHEVAYVKASNTGAGDVFGSSVAMSGDGSLLAIGASAEDSAATGLDGDQRSDAATASGAVYVLQ